jgi:hypothetical protein
MSTSVSDKRIRTVHTTDDELVVTFVDGRTLSVPLDWYPRLRNASAEQRKDWRLIGEGEGIHWSQIDEDLSAEGLLRGVTAPGVRLQASSFGETHDNEQTRQALMPPKPSLPRPEEPIFVEPTFVEQTSKNPISEKPTSEELISKEPTS